MNGKEDLIRILLVRRSLRSGQLSIVFGSGTRQSARKLTNDFERGRKSTRSFSQNLERFLKDDSSSCLNWSESPKKESEIKQRKLKKGFLCCSHFTITQNCLIIPLFPTRQIRYSDLLYFKNKTGWNCNRIRIWTEPSHNLGAKTVSIKLIAAIISIKKENKILKKQKIYLIRGRINLTNICQEEC